MRRADRLFAIVQALRGGRLTTAARLAAALEVSERTIYRDMTDLQATGVPIEGEAGVGYVMAGGYDLPPLRFPRTELVALVAGARMVRGFGGAAMARAAEEALVKIEAVLPEDMARAINRIGIHVPTYKLSPLERTRVDMIEVAIARRAVLDVAYEDQKGEATRREVEPLALTFWGGHWTLIGWCRLREDFRMFRLNRMGSVALTGEVARPLRERSLKAMRDAMIARGEVPHGFDFSDIGL